MFLLGYYIQRLDKRLGLFWENYSQLENKLGERNLLARNVRVLRKDWCAAFNLHCEYQQKIQSISGWVKSFIPFRHEFKIRRQLSLKLSSTKGLLLDAHVITKVFLKRIDNKHITKKQIQHNDKKVPETTAIKKQHYKPVFNRRLPVKMPISSFIVMHKNTEAKINSVQNRFYKRLPISYFHTMHCAIEKQINTTQTNFKLR